jgi:hypothetical protein
MDCWVTTPLTRRWTTKLGASVAVASRRVEHVQKLKAAIVLSLVGPAPAASSKSNGIESIGERVCAVLWVEDVAGSDALTFKVLGDLHE